MPRGSPWCPLRSVAPECGGDLETIVATALAKDPGRRYQTAIDLAADLRRFLDEQPISARSASVAYSIRKFARRNRPLAWSSLVSFILLVGGVAFWQREKDKAHAANAEFTFVMLERVLGPIWEQIGSVKERRELLVKLHDKVEREASLYPNDLRAQLNYARVLDRSSDQEETESHPREAFDYARRAADVYDHLAVLWPDDPDRRHDLSIAIVRRGDQAGRLRMLDERLRCYQLAFQMDLASRARWPDSPRFLNDLAFGYERLAACADASGDRTGALRLAEGELQLSDEAVSRWPDDPNSLWLRVSARGELAFLRLLSGHLEEAMRLQRLHIQAVDELFGKFPGNRKYALATVKGRVALANMLEAGDPEAMERLAQARAIVDRLAAEDPGDFYVQDTVFEYELARVGRADVERDTPTFLEAWPRAGRAEAELSRRAPGSYATLSRHARYAASAVGPARRCGDESMRTKVLDETTADYASLCTCPEASPDDFANYARALLVDHDAPTAEMVVTGWWAAAIAMDRGSQPLDIPLVALAYAAHHRGLHSEADALLVRAKGTLDPIRKHEVVEWIKTVRAAWKESGTALR